MLTVRDAATVAVAPLQGGPRATAEKLAPAVAEALQKREIPASDRTMSIASYQLDGRLQAMPPAGDKAAIVVLWNLRDPSGKSLGTRAERIEASAGDWQAGKNEAVARLAEASAEQIAAMLQDKAPVEAAAQAKDSGETRLSIGGVEGAPGDGDTSLASAITTLLTKAGSGDRLRSSGKSRSAARCRRHRRQTDGGRATCQNRLACPPQERRRDRHCGTGKRRSRRAAQRRVG